MKLNTTIKTLYAAVAFAASAAASAGQIYLNIGTDHGSNGSATSPYVCETCTGIKDELNIDYKSITTLNLSTGTFTGFFGWDGSAASLDSNNVTAFDPTSGSNGYGYDSNFWFMTFSGTASGTFTVNGLGEYILTYNTGEIKLFASETPSDMSSYSQFMTIGLTGGQLIGGNTDIYGKVTATMGDYKDLINSVYKPSCAATNSFTDILLCGDEAPIHFTGDFNTDDATFTPSDFVLDENGKLVPTKVTVTGEHGGSVKFDVPEPASLALLGVGLLGLGAIRRRRTA